jgi:hypothetical protein
MVEHILRGLPCKVVVDEVVVRTGSAKVHLKVVEEVLTRLGSCNLKMERSGWRDP